MNQSPFQKKISFFYRTQRIITVFTRFRHQPFSWARWIHFTPSNAITLYIRKVGSCVSPCTTFPARFCIKQLSVAQGTFESVSAPVQTWNIPLGGKKCSSEVDLFRHLKMRKLKYSIHAVIRVRSTRIGNRTYNLSHRQQPRLFALYGQEMKRWSDSEWWSSNFKNRIFSWNKRHFLVLV